jgi:uroporphyrinogen-III synthase
VRVLLTRPVAEARRTARQLEQAGHEAIHAPVLVIRSLGAALPPGPFAAFVATSGNAFSQLDPVPSLSLADREVFCVGDQSAAAAAKAGFRHVRSAAGDARALAGLLVATFPAGTRLLYLAGRERKAELEQFLLAAGLDVAVAEIYTAEPVRVLPEEGREALRSGTLDGVLHYSRRSAAALVRLAEAAGVLPELRGLTQFAISEDSAAPLRRAGCDRVAVAATPDETSLLALLRARA